MYKLDLLNVNAKYFINEFKHMYILMKIATNVIIGKHFQVINRAKSTKQNI